MSSFGFGCALFGSTVAFLLAVALLFVFFAEALLVLGSALIFTGIAFLGRWPSAWSRDLRWRNRHPMRSADVGEAHEKQKQQATTAVR